MTTTRQTGWASSGPSNEYLLKFHASCREQQFGVRRDAHEPHESNDSSLFVPFVNRPDLLKLCIDSLSIRLTTEPVIINNSGKELPPEFPPLTPSVTPENPLTFSQTQNLMLELAAEEAVLLLPSLGRGRQRRHPRQAL